MKYVNHFPCAVVLAILAFAGGLAGCTFPHVEPAMTMSPTQKYSVIAVGEIAAEDKAWEPLVAHFRRGFVDKLTESKTFDSVQDPAREPLAESSVVLSGKITEVNKGNETLRLLVGFGAGRALVSGTFTVRDASGATLAKFDGREAYAGGLGIGGGGFVSMEDLMRRFGGTVAEKTVQWSRGE